MADYRSAYYGLTGSLPTDVEEAAAEDYLNRLSSSLQERLAALAGWISGGTIAGGMPGPRYGSLRLGSKGKRGFAALSEVGSRKGPRVDIPEELMQEVGGGFRVPGSSLGKPSVREAREAAGRADIPSAEYAASTEAPGGRATLGAPPQGVRSGGVYDLTPMTPQYRGFQEGYGSKPGYHLYDLLEDITDESGKTMHPRGSTVSERTLRKYGIQYRPPGSD